MNEFNNLKNFCEFLHTGREQLLAEYDSDEARRLFSEHLYNLMYEADVDGLVADSLSYDLTRMMFDSAGSKFKLETDTYETYMLAEDVTIIWQNIYINGECIQRNLIGWYCGEPDPEATKTYSLQPLTATFDELYQ